MYLTFIHPLGIAWSFASFQTSLGLWTTNVNNIIIVAFILLSFHLHFFKKKNKKHIYTS